MSDNEWFFDKFDKPVQDKVGFMALPPTVLLIMFIIAGVVMAFSFI